MAPAHCRTIAKVSPHGDLSKVSGYRDSLLQHQDRARAHNQRERGREMPRRVLNGVACLHGSTKVRFHGDHDTCSLPERPRRSHGRSGRFAFRIGRVAGARTFGNRTACRMSVFRSSQRKADVPVGSPSFIKTLQFFACPRSDGALRVIDINPLKIFEDNLKKRKSSTGAAWRPMR